MNETDSYFTTEIESPSAPSERLLYPNLSTVSEQLIREASTPLIRNAAAANKQLSHNVAAKQISNAATVNEQLINEIIKLIKNLILIL